MEREENSTVEAEHDEMCGRDQDLYLHGEETRKFAYKLNSVAVVHKQTIPTERPPLVGEVNGNLCG
jgi:hypothetical protein